MILRHTHSHNRSTWILLSVILLALTASSCTAKLRNQQLEQVAKDWALVIRASQVIPVYPLSEDLQPGDVLLVSTPIEDQVSLYKEKGFLPLDQHLVRLYSDEFKDFYNSRYGITDSVIPPAQWQAQNATGKHNWHLAPHVAFPTYQFAVATGSGLNLAIPIQGVPFALGLMNSGKASGTVTISDAFTFGLDNVRLSRLVHAWGLKPENRSLLSQYAPYHGRAHFLRVISRVYATGQVSVTVNNDEAMSGQASGGTDKSVELLGIAKGDTDKNYSTAIEAIGKLAEKLPGGKIKIATASSRSVTLSETFDRPLVIGYVGFDMQILDGGGLGPPMSTLAQLNAGKIIPTRNAGSIYRLAAFSHIHKTLTELKSLEADRVRGQLDKLAQRLPGKYSFSLYDFSAPGSVRKDTTIFPGSPVDHSGFGDVLAYLGYAQTTFTTLDSYLPKAPRGTAMERDTVTLLETERQAAKTAYEQGFTILMEEPALTQAVDLVLFEQSP